MKEANFDTHDEKCDAHDAALLDLFLLYCVFTPKNWYNVFGRSFWKAENVLPFVYLMGNINFLGKTEIAKIAVSLHCDTRNTFSTHFHQTTIVINVKIVIQKVGKDPEQSLGRVFC